MTITLRNDFHRTSAHTKEKTMSRHSQHLIIIKKGSDEIRLEYTANPPLDAYTVRQHLLEAQKFCLAVLNHASNVPATATQDTSPSTNS